MISRVFDCLPRLDPRNRDYPIRSLIPPGTRRRSYTWACDTWLDQGKEGACTGFATAHELAARPVAVQGLVYTFAWNLYKLSQTFDQWPGEGYVGSSVEGAMAAGKALGYYGEYRWAFGEDDLALAIGYRGPAVLGINWYEGMLETDSQGWVKPTGKIKGRHAICCRGYNVKTDRYRLRNSWGKVWGIDGDCFISSADMKKLLAERGVAAIPVVRLNKKLMKAA